MSLSFSSAKTQQNEAPDPWQQARKRVKYLNNMMHGKIGARDVIHDACEMDIKLVDVSVNENAISLKYPISKTDATLAPFSYTLPPVVVESVETRAPGFKSEKVSGGDKWNYKFNITVAELPPADVVTRKCSTWREEQKKAFEFQNALHDKVAEFIIANPSLYPDYRKQCSKEAVKEANKEKLSGKDLQERVEVLTNEKILSDFHNVLTQYVALGQDDEAFKDEDIPDILKENPRSIKISTKAFVENKTSEKEPEDVKRVLDQNPNDPSALKVREAYKENQRLRMPKVTVNGKEVKGKSIFESTIGRGDTVRPVITPFPWYNGSLAGLAAIWKTVDVLVRAPVQSRAAQIDNSKYLDANYNAEDPVSLFGKLQGFDRKVAEFIQEQSAESKTCTIENVIDNFEEASEDNLKATLEKLCDEGYISRNDDGTLVSVDHADDVANEDVGKKRKNAGPPAGGSDSPPTKKRFSVPGDSDSD